MIRLIRMRSVNPSRISVIRLIRMTDIRNDGYPKNDGYPTTDTDGGMTDSNTTLNRYARHTKSRGGEKLSGNTGEDRCSTPHHVILYDRVYLFVYLFIILTVFLSSLSF